MGANSFNTSRSFKYPKTQVKRVNGGFWEVNANLFQSLGLTVVVRLSVLGPRLSFVSVL